MTELSWSSYHTELRDQLAMLYLDRAAAQRIATDAGMNIAFVTFSDNAANNWHDIVRVAEQQGRLIPLIERAIAEYPTNETLPELRDKLMIPLDKAMTALRKYDLPALSGIVDILRKRIPNAPETWYLNFRLQFMQLAMQDAIASLDRLLQMPIVDGELPLKVDQLKEIQTTLHYWKAALLLLPGDPPAPLEVTMQVGENETQLEEATRERLTLGEVEFDVPQIEHGALTRFTVVNKGGNPAHIYFVKAMPDGQIHVGALLTAPESFDGIGAGQRGQGPLFPAVDTPSVIEIRLFYSPRRIDKMLTPVTPAVQQLPGAEILEQDVAGVRVMRFWFQVADLG